MAGLCRFRALIATALASSGRASLSYFLFGRTSLSFGKPVLDRSRNSTLHHPVDSTVRWRSSAAVSGAVALLGSVRFADREARRSFWIRKGNAGSSVPLDDSGMDSQSSHALSLALWP